MLGLFEPPTLEMLEEAMIRDRWPFPRGVVLADLWDVERRMRRCARSCRDERECHICER